MLPSQGVSSAEHSRLIRAGAASVLDTCQPPAPPLSAGFHVFSVLIRSSPCSTVRSLVRMIHFETNAPAAPWARTMPAELGSSWFISTVNVPSPLSNAPRPSGIPTIRYGVPSGFRLTESPHPAARARKPASRTCVGPAGAHRRAGRPCDTRGAPRVARPVRTVRPQSRRAAGIRGQPAAGGTGPPAGARRAVRRPGAGPAARDGPAPAGRRRPCRGGRADGRDAREPAPRPRVHGVLPAPGAHRPDRVRDLPVRIPGVAARAGQCLGRQLGLVRPGGRGCPLAPPLWTGVSQAGLQRRALF